MENEKRNKRNKRIKNKNIKALLPKQNNKINKILLSKQK